MDSKMAQRVRKPPLEKAGLSHVAEEVEEEGIFPTGAFDLLANGDAGRVGSNDIDRGAPQDSEVVGTIVFSGSRGVFAEDDIEHPVKLVFDAPMTTHDLQQSFCRKVLGQQVEPRDRLA